MITIVKLHFLVAALAPALVRRFERRTFLLLALVPLGSFLWLLRQAQAAFDGDVRTGEPCDKSMAQVDFFTIHWILWMSF